MTGYFVRVERNGRWQNLEIETLTDAELDALQTIEISHHGSSGWQWTKALAKWIRDNVPTPPPDPPDRSG